ncbi:AQG_2a_G0003450.mRNA.1.CDS.1 [Saccharomyces cerevisiae]|nr:AQG_2a_G0003450.mRNA.1.CDS.1 [Saccharomyces cerevisiae]CAI4267615.1 BDN_1c_G0003110.mRNA.1.CDS.1 [Saccharomyces cerevisiae]CAI7045427.1 BDN_1c_G0003110.mRNA.1.CDS.1 [Saccharomyces cerevisiae]CAI7046551.1 AQG_2a_G0003450.mRNA.1.CDS.1 [Saccharomyces cerevisiae]
MAITPDKQKKEQQHQPQNGPLDYAHICKCIAMFFVVAGVVLMFFETGLDPEQKEQIKRLHQLDSIPHA